MNQSRATLPATALWWATFVKADVDLGTGRLRRKLFHHPVPAFHLPHRVIVHLLTWPEFVDDAVAVTHTLHDHVLVVDRYLGTLPLVAVDQHSARAAGEAWFAKLQGRRMNPGEFKTPRADQIPQSRFDPHNPQHVMDWAREFADRTPSTRLITEVTWPPGLPLTPYHPNQGTSR